MGRQTGAALDCPSGPAYANPRSSHLQQEGGEGGGGGGGMGWVRWTEFGCKTAWL